MSNKMVAAVGLALAVSAGSALAESTAMSGGVTCADLNWSAEILANNPDIGRACEAVYEKDGRLYAKVPIEIVRVRGNRMTFRPVYTDDSYGDSRSVVLASSWRANIDGRQYRASDLVRGQSLNVYIPEDRFALVVEDESVEGPVETEMVAIEEEVVEMPTTASPLFLVGLVGGAFLALGGVLSGLRRRLG